MVILRETVCKQEGRVNILLVTFLFGLDFLICIYQLHFLGKQDYGPLLVVLYLYFCFKIHNKCLTILILFQIGSKCQHTSLCFDTKIKVKKKLRASNNTGCPGFTFHCLNIHLPKLNTIIPLCLQICQITSCSRHESICCLLKSNKAGHIFLLNATPNSILEFNCLSFVQLKDNTENITSFVAFLEVCFPMILFLLST